MLEEVKLYLRVDGTLEDELISSMISAATEYIKSASGKTGLRTGGELTDSELVRLAIQQLVAHWYDHRGTEWLGQAGGTEISYSVKALLAHITTCGDYV